VEYGNAGIRESGIREFWLLEKKKSAIFCHSSLRWNDKRMKNDFPDSRIPAFPYSSLHFPCPKQANSIDYRTQTSGNPP
jgi:hypothetical protein